MVYAEKQPRAAEPYRGYLQVVFSPPRRFDLPGEAAVSAAAKPPSITS